MSALLRIEAGQRVGGIERLTAPRATLQIAADGIDRAGATRGRGAGLRAGGRPRAGIEKRGEVIALGMWASALPKRVGRRAGVFSADQVKGKLTRRPCRCGSVECRAPGGKKG